MQDQGLAHTTTKQIAGAAGYSEATLYKHFQDKAELIFSLMRERLPTHFIDTLAELPQRAGTRTVRANLEQVAREAVPFYEQCIPMMAALFAEPALLARHQEALREEGRGPHLANRPVTAYLRAEQRLGRLPDTLRPHSVAALLLGACFQRAFMTLFVGDHTNDQSTDRFAKELATSLVQRST